MQSSTIEYLNNAPAQSLDQNDALEVLKASDRVQFGQECLIAPSRRQAEDSTHHRNRHRPKTTVQRVIGIQKLTEDQWISERGRNHLLEISDAMTDAVGGLERIRNTSIPPPYDFFVRVINWVFGTQLLLSFKSQGSALTGNSAVFRVPLAYVEGPFDQDGSRFSMPLNKICVGISEDLMPIQLDYGRYRSTWNPVFWC